MIGFTSLLVRLRLVLLLTCSFGASIAPDLANGQIVRRFPGGGVIVNAPFVRVEVGPYGLGTRTYVGPRRRAVLPYQPPTTNGVGMSARQPARRQLSSEDRGGLPSARELRQMPDYELLNSLAGLNQRLEQRLARFTTGDGWQRYLNLPADALPPPSSSGSVTLGMTSLRDTLERFNSSAANPDYRVINTLPTFMAMRSALEEVVQRFGDRSPMQVENDTADSQRPAANVEQPAADAAESLPAPQPEPSVTPTPRSPDGQTRSILKR